MKSLIAMALAAATLAAQPAAAQLAKNSKGPIDITADEGETHNSDCTAIWRGSAEALQETSRLRSDVLIAHLEVKKGKPGGGAAPGADSGSACGEMISLEARGNVYYVSADGRRVHGDVGVYDATNTTLTVTGDVVAVDGQNVMRGTRMVYNTQTGEGRVEGGAKGPGAKNRPRGVFYPKNSGDQAAASPNATTPAASSPADKPKKAGK